MWQSADRVLSAYLDGDRNGGVYTPGHLAMYGYVLQNPVRYKDPDGLSELLGAPSWSDFANKSPAERQADARDMQRSGAVLHGYAVGLGVAIPLLIPGAEIEGLAEAQENIGAGAYPDDPELAGLFTGGFNTGLTVGFWSGIVSGGAKGKSAPVEGIYEFKDAKVNKPYVGQSSNIPNRLKQHQASGKLAPNTPVKTTEVKGGKTTREIAEHRRIQEITGGVPARQSPDVANEVDPIGPARQHLLN